jgi:hypothetical protein
MTGSLRMPDTASDNVVMGDEEPASEVGSSVTHAMSGDAGASLTAGESTTTDAAAKELAERKVQGTEALVWRSPCGRKGR